MDAESGRNPHSPDENVGASTLRAHASALSMEIVAVGEVEEGKETVATASAAAGLDQL